MKESAFIEQNKEKWSEFEEALKQKNESPTKLSRLFVQITDDLSFARTFYKNRSVRVYLNGVAQILYSELYRKRRAQKGGFAKFWTRELPLQFFHARREFLVSFLIFFLFVAIGAYSCANDGEFARSILGNGYVDMTLENIEKGDPMAVYKKSDPVKMFVRITLNNLRVDLLTFVTGVFASMGTILVLLYNGVMVGTFQYFFVDSGYFKESVLTIWQHGTIEISMIVISGGAGLCLGKGLIFPGTLTRAQAFRITAQRGLKIMLAVFLLTVVAGFIESFLTRHTETPDVVRILVILLSLSFVIFYFGIYPRMVYRKYGHLEETQIVNPIKVQPIETKSIKGFTNIFGSMIQALNERSKLYFRTVFLTAMVYAVTGFVSQDYFLAQADELELEFGFMGFLNYAKNPWLAIANTIIFMTVSLVFSKMVYDYDQGEKRMEAPELFKFIAKHFVTALVVSLGMNALIFWDVALRETLLILLVPFALAFVSQAVIREGHVGTGISKGWSAIFGNFSNVFILFLTFFGLGLAIVVLYESSLFHFLFESIRNLYDFEGNTQALVTLFLLRFSAMAFITAWLGAYMIAMSFWGYSVKEKQDAHNLLERVKDFGGKCKFKFEKGR